MKRKLLLIILFVFISKLCAIAGYVTLGYYHNLLHDKDCIVFLEYDDKSPKKDALILIEVRTIESYTGVIGIKEKDLKSFVKSLKKLRDKTIEWTKISNENGVKVNGKEIPVKFPEISLFWKKTKEDSWNADIDETLTFKFETNEIGGTYAIWQAVGVSRKNDSMEGFTFAIKNVDEYNKLLEILDVKQIKNILDEKQKENDLFK